jgi:AraC family transcriptional regulator
MPQFEVTDLTAQPFAYLTKTAQIKGIAEVMGQSFAELGKAFAAAAAPMTGPPLCHYMGFDGATTTFQVGFPYRPDDGKRLTAAGLTIGTTQAGQVMKATHKGPYETVVETYNAMQSEMQQRHLVGADDMWEIYMSPPETPPEEILTQVIWPVRRAA